MLRCVEWRKVCVMKNCWGQGSWEALPISCSKLPRWCLYPQCICHHPLPMAMTFTALLRPPDPPDLHSYCTSTQPPTFRDSDSSAQETYLSLLSFPFQFIASTCSKPTRSTFKRHSQTSPFLPFPHPTNHQVLPQGDLSWVEHTDFQVTQTWVQMLTLSLLAWVLGQDII